MAGNIYRRKLLQAIVFFAANIKRLNTTKLAKLLYYFDFDHFKATGYPALGLSYYAYPQGPLPLGVWREIVSDRMPDDLAQVITVVTEKFEKGFEECEERHIKLKPRVSFEAGLFTPREMAILNRLAEIYRDQDTSIFIDASHEQGGPWQRTLRGKGQKEIIDYLLEVDDEDGEEKVKTEESLNDYFSMIHNFGLTPTHH